MLSSKLARSASAGVILIAVAVCAFGPATPTATAQTQSAASAQLAEGVGMGPRPSVRVRRLQRVVDRAGYDVGPTGIDGRFGPFTAAAVRRMQRTYGLVPDGIVGPKTRRLVGLIADRQRARRSRSSDARPQNGQQTPSTPAPSTSTPAPPSSTAPAQTTPAPAQTTPAQTTPAQTTPAQPAPAQTAPAPAAPATQPADTTTVDGTPAAASNNTTERVLIAALAALAAAALALLAFRGRRKDPAPELVPIGRDLYLEGESEDTQVGTFSGHALATALPGGRGTSNEARFLVDDPRKPAPVWVRSTEIRRSPGHLAPGEPVIGYASGDKRSSVSREALERIQTACDEGGWELIEVVHDEETPQLLNGRGLSYALEEISEGRARGLVVGDVSRLAPSLTDMAKLVEWFRDADAALIIPDLHLNTATAEGDRMGSVLMTLSRWQLDRTRRSSGELRAVRDPGRPRGSS
jgi:peptidoglycan hydrolase-like protein with peptidoglycan-binding domain